MQREIKGKGFSFIFSNQIGDGEFLSPDTFNQAADELQIQANNNTFDTSVLLASVRQSQSSVFSEIKLHPVKLWDWEGIE